MSPETIVTQFGLRSDCDMSFADMAWLLTAIMESVREQTAKVVAEKDAEIAKLKTGNERLRDWKESAMTVLADWDKVGDALGGKLCVKQLGRSMAKIALERATEILKSNAELLGGMRRFAEPHVFEPGYATPNDVLNSIQRLAEAFVAEAEKRIGPR